MEHRKFDIFLDPAAGRDLKRLKDIKPDAFSGIDNAIDSLALQPYQGKQLKGKLKKCLSLRIGKHRVIYQVYPARNAVNIIRVGDRKDIYRF